MFDTGKKPALLLPLAILIFPGTCYFYVAIIPSYRSDFAIIGIGLTGLLFLMAIWRVLQPHQTDTHMFRSVAAHVLCLPIMFLAYRLWNTLAPTLSVVIGVALFILYLSSWLAPFWTPKVSRYIYREVFWFPNPTLAVIMLFVTLLAFGYSFYTGLHISESGNRSILFAASTMTILQVAETFYFSAQLQQQKQGKEPFPLEVERQKRIHRSVQIESLFTYFSLCVSVAGWIVSVGTFVMYLKSKALYPETEHLLGIAFLILTGFARSTLRYYFRRLPWYAIAIPIVILLYGLWHIPLGFGNLSEMPPDIRVVAKYHQMITYHSFFISGYTFFCFLWAYITWEQFPKRRWV